MHIENNVVTDFNAHGNRGKDRDELKKWLADKSQTQGYAAVASDGVTFASSFTDSANLLQVIPPKGEQFSASDISVVIACSPVFFGVPHKIVGLIRGHLDRGSVLEAVDAIDPKMVGYTLPLRAAEASIIKEAQGGTDMSL